MRPGAAIDTSRVSLRPSDHSRDDHVNGLDRASAILLQGLGTAIEGRSFESPPPQEVCVEKPRVRRRKGAAAATAAAQRFLAWFESCSCLLSWAFFMLSSFCCVLL